MKLRITHTLALAAIVATATFQLAAAEDIIIADFEGPDYGSWKASGDAFGSKPARGTLPGQMTVSGYEGKGLANSFNQGDDSTGTLISPEFRIQRPFIHFLIGGGKNPTKLSLSLVVDGKSVRTSTGPNDQAGGSEALALESWDVREFMGKDAAIQIIDDAKGGWGHINVDHIVQTERRAPQIQSNVQREFKITKQYLHLPIQNGAPKRLVTALVDGHVQVRNDVELANGKPDWWAPMDVSEWKGRSLTLQVDRLRDDSSALSSIHESDSIAGSESLYQEPLRGQFHFSPRRGWNNDPNGMVFFKGEYHLFFQHNPYGWGWGNMHWGHAVSKDLVHWTELGDKLAPDAYGPMFSGSAVVDWKNTSGLGKDGQAPLVLIYTAAGDPTVQCIASSLDGRHFQKFEGNPVIPQITGGNRDPKVMWHEPTQRWVMVLYVGFPGDKHTVYFFTSPNLRDWKHASTTEGMAKSGYLFECPDFFELAVDGNPANRKWVLAGANTEYGIGTFDGTRFTPEYSRLPGQRGRGFYAPQTFSDIPSSDGRRIQIGWFQTETKGMTFNQSMTIPLELNLISTSDGPRLTYTPVKELSALRSKSHRMSQRKLSAGGENPAQAVQAELMEIRAELEPGDAKEIALTVRGSAIVYDVSKQELSVNGHRVPAPLRGGKQRLTVFCDRTGLEVFASDGLTYVPMPFQPHPNDRNVWLGASGGTATASSFEIHELRSAWKSR